MAAPLEHTRRYRDDPRRSELDAACLVATLVAGGVDRDGAAAALAGLATDVERSVEGLIARLAGAGFAGAADYYALDNSRIDRVLETRRGIPITLAVVYLEVGRRAGLDVQGIGFPGHFLVRVDGTLVDPFGHRALDGSTIERMAAQHTPRHTLDALLEPASPDAMALRMINNVKGVILAARGERAIPEVLDLVDCQLALGADPTPLHLERAELWGRLRSPDGVRAALEDARHSCRDPALAREIERRLAALPGIAGGPAH